MFPFLLATLAFVTLVAIVAPLLRGRGAAASRAQFDQAVYRDQLRELDRDIERGLLTPDEAATARLEIQRRLLATDRVAAEPTVSASRPMRSPAMAAFVFIVVAGGSIGTYLWIGTPWLPDMPFGSSAQEAMLTEDKEQIDIQKAAEQLAAKLKENPNDARGWQLLGRTYALMGRFDDAVGAYRQAVTLGETDPDTAAAYAEVQVMAAGGNVTPAAEALFRKVLTSDPTSGVARYYLGLAAGQAGEPKKAIDMWVALLGDMPSDSPMRDQIAARIADAARTAGIQMPALPKGTAPAAGPDSEAVAQAESMPPEQRQAMIQGMVARLAAKQEADPANFAGWMQLGRAYAVLQETDKAADAYDKAMALKPDDASVPLQAVQELTRGQDPKQKLSPRLIALLRKVQLTNPREPIALWFLGVAALQAKHPDEAKRYWTDLLGVLPPSSPDARTVQSALDMLAKASAGSGG
ncbi:MAG: c-type cytochrome biogenesis protein CcmI [Acetobacteraceae bacterium]|nr:c-type cytochrome biogenesis protein CcmI [Pseudomonadota bacterium]